MYLKFTERLFTNSAALVLSLFLITCDTSMQIAIQNQKTFLILHIKRVLQIRMSTPSFVAFTSTKKLYFRLILLLLCSM